MLGVDAPVTLLQVAVVAGIYAVTFVHHLHLNRLALAHEERTEIDNLRGAHHRLVALHSHGNREDDRVLGALVGRERHIELIGAIDDGLSVVDEIYGLQLALLHVALSGVEAEHLAPSRVLAESGNGP